MKAIAIAALGAVVALGLAAAPVGAVGDGKKPQPLRCPGKANAPVQSKPIRDVTVEKARLVALDRGCELRVVRIDGENQVITADLSAERVNVSVRNGRIVRATGIY